MANQYEQFLKTSLSKYKNPDVAKQDVTAVFNAFTDLRPKLDDYVFGDGTKKTLLQLDGTIPVTYRGCIFNIPVAIWLRDTHPYSAPIVYVMPTSSMVLKPGPNMDTTGKIHLPCLSEWKYPNSDLVSLIQILTIIFGEEPPVYSKVAFTVQQPYPNQGAGQTPYPTEQDSDDEELQMLREELKRVEERKRKAKKEQEKEQLRRQVENAKAELREMEEDEMASDFQSN